MFNSKESELIKKYGKDKIDAIKNSVVKAGAMAKLDKIMPIEASKPETSAPQSEHMSHNCQEADCKNIKMNDDEFEKASKLLQDLTQGDNSKGFIIMASIKEENNEGAKIEGMSMMRQFNVVKAIQIFIDAMDLTPQQAISILQVGEIMSGRGNSKN